MRDKLWTLVAGFSLLAPIILFRAPFASELPNAIYPLPALMVIPAFLGLRQAAPAVPVLLFFVWNPRLFRGDAAVPKRSYFLLFIATLLTPLWFIVGWKDGVAYQGVKYNWSVSAVNFVWLAALWIFFIRRRKMEPSFKANLLFHWMISA